MKYSQQSHLGIGYVYLAEQYKGWMVATSGEKKLNDMSLELS